jgi:hypothetical protein
VRNASVVAGLGVLALLLPSGQGARTLLQAFAMPWVGRCGPLVLLRLARLGLRGARLLGCHQRLRGGLVGHTCPPFSFKTADGKEVSRDSLAGKPFILDIWSIT